MRLLKRAEQDAEEVTKLHINETTEKPQKAKEYYEEQIKKEKIPEKDLSLEDLQRAEKILVKTILYGTAYFYMTTLKINPKLVSEVDAKFMKVLGILP